MSSILNRLKPASKQDGYTLIELLIYALLMSAIVAVVGAIIFTALNGQRDIQNSASGNNGGQLIAQSLTQGIQSSTYIKVTTVSATTQMLQVATPGVAATASTKCQAWYITTDNGGAVYTTTSASTIAAPTVSALASWRLIASGVAKSTRSGAPSTMLTSSGSPATSVTFEFTMTNGTGQPILISSSATSRQNIAGAGSTQCV